MVDTQLKPKTIHDFGGFPQALFDVQYPAPGHPELARSAIAALAQSGARPSEEWGLDHGTWSVLRWLYPAADVPTFQVSIDYSKPPRFHWALGQALAALRHPRGAHHRQWQHRAQPARHRPQWPRDR